MNFWIARKDRYPFVSRETLISRAWLLIRKVINQDNAPTENDVRVARILINASDRCQRFPAHLTSMLEEVIINGPPPVVCSCESCSASPEEGVGS